jgi:hypothetical protein
MIRCLWAGETRANSVVRSTASASFSSLISSICTPRSVCSVERPTSEHTFLATRSLSPVMTFTDTP